MEIKGNKFELIFAVKRIGVSNFDKSMYEPKLVKPDENLDLEKKFEVIIEVSRNLH